MPGSPALFQKSNKRDWAKDLVGAITLITSEIVKHPKLNDALAPSLKTLDIKNVCAKEDDLRELISKSDGLIKAAQLSEHFTAFNKTLGNIIRGLEAQRIDKDEVKIGFER